jgi:WD40 repeat protein
MVRRGSFVKFGSVSALCLGLMALAGGCGKGVTTTLDVAEIEALTGRQVITAAEAGQVALLDTFRHPNRIERLRFNSDSTLLASTEDGPGSFDDAEYEETLQLWDVESGERVWAGAGDFWPGIAFSSGEKLAYADGVGGVLVRDVVSGEEERFPVPEEVVRLDISRDGTRLAAAGEQSIWAWEVRTGERTTLVEGIGRGRPIVGLAFAPDGSELYYVAGLELWCVDLDTGDASRLGASADSGPGGYGDIRLSPDGSMLAVVSQFGGGLDLWDVTSGEMIGNLPGEGFVDFSPDGSLLVSKAGRATTYPLAVGIWDVATQTLVAELAGNTGNASAAAFSPDGTLIATADIDGNVLLWGISDQSQNLPTVVLAGAEEAFLVSGRVPPSWVASADESARHQIEFVSSTNELGRARYDGNHTYVVLQRILEVTVTDLQTQEVVGAATFKGDDSFNFPDQHSFYESTEYEYNEPSEDEFADWIEALMRELGYDT